jgi:hypothetical protein
MWTTATNLYFTRLMDKGMDWEEQPTTKPNRMGKQYREARHNKIHGVHGLRGLKVIGAILNEQYQEATQVRSREVQGPDVEGDHPHG